MLCGGSSQSIESGNTSLQFYNKIPQEAKKKFELAANRSELTNNDTFMKQFSLNKPLNSIKINNKNAAIPKYLSEDLRNFVVKKTMKSNYQNLIQNYKYTEQKWTDPDFPPTQKSWGTSKSNVVWKRVGEILPEYKFINRSISPNDIMQGKLGDCYFQSAVAGLAEKPYRIKNLFPNLQVNKNGIYMAKIMHKGVYQQVVVDDYFPCYGNNKLLAALPSISNQIWVMVLEKCWAKLFGSYDAIEGGLPDQVLHAFSAAPTYHHRIKGKSKQQIDSLWGKIVEADQKGYIVCCGTQNQTKDSILQQNGLVGGHAYTILGAYEQPYKILKLRNPWGQLQWKGRGNDSDTKFWSKISPQDKEYMGYKSREDGTFFMLWEDFQKYFVIVDFCYIEDNFHYFYIQNLFSKNIPICFDLNLEGGALTFTVSQKSLRQLTRQQNKKQNQKLANVVLILGKANQNNKQFSYIRSQSDYSKSDLHCYYPNLAPGNYTLCCFIDGKKPEYTSTVSVYSQQNIIMTESKVNRDQFIQNVYLDHARSNLQARQYLSQNPSQWVCMDILTDKCGFGYSAFHLDPKSIKKLGIEFQESEYLQNNIELLPPYKGAGKFKLVCDIGREIIVICRLQPGNYAESFMMPTPKIYRLR